MVGHSDSLLVDVGLVNRLDDFFESLLVKIMCKRRMNYSLPVFFSASMIISYLQNCGKLSRIRKINKGISTDVTK